MLRNHTLKGKNRESTRWDRRTFYTKVLMNIGVRAQKFAGGSPFNFKSDGSSSPMEILLIRGLQRALESLRHPQKSLRSLRGSLRGL